MRQNVAAQPSLLQPLREWMDQCKRSFEAPHPPGGAKFFQKFASPLISCLSFLTMPALWNLYAHLIADAQIAVILGVTAHALCEAWG
jgi:hypothetical protein